MAVAAWAVVRPDSPALAVWIVSFGIWWLISEVEPLSSTALRLAMLIVAAHQVTALRATCHRSTRLTLPYLARVLLPLIAIVLVTVIVEPLVRMRAGDGVQADLPTLVWTVAAVVVLVGLAAWFTRGDRELPQK